MGIDYGRGMTNIDLSTGYRYGVTSVHNLASWIWEEIEYVYSQACPKCGSEPQRNKTSDNPKCTVCGKRSPIDRWWGDEPVSNRLTIEGVEGWIDGSNDVWVVKSSYVYRANFCSPCAPGAGYITPGTNGDDCLAYGLPPDYFRTIYDKPYDCKSDIVRQGRFRKGKQVRSPIYRITWEEVWIPDTLATDPPTTEGARMPETD